MLVSVIVPVRHDTEALLRLIARLEALQSVDATMELVVGAAPMDAQLSAIAKAPATTVLESPPGRGQQLNSAALEAKGDILWCLHADAMPPLTALQDIVDAVSSGAQGGWFRFRFGGPQSLAKQRLAKLINWRAEHGVAYGDQGLFFTRGLFESAGGFDQLPLFEEVRLVKACKRTGQFSSLASAITVDPRRWQQDGWIRRTLTNRALALLYACGVSAERLARWYQRHR